jgi:DNA-binding LacI/PurR family transcriptional regulator
MTQRKSPPVTQRAIAEALGVSVATVSLALRDSPLIRAETRERVQRHVREVGYVRNRAATALRTGRTRIIGVAFHDIVHPFLAEMLSATEARLSEAGEAIFVNSHDDDMARQARFIDSLLQHDADGLILSPALGTREADLEAFRAQGGAVVLIVRSIPGTTLDHVVNDDAACMRLATRHLLGLGHERVLMLGGKPGTTTADGRYRGFCEAVREAGGAVGADDWIAGFSKRLEAHAAVKALWAERSDPPTAIACFNDLVAFGAMSALADLGLEVGRDVAVVGIDDTDEAQVSFPPLTTVTNNARAIGEQAVEILRARLADPDAPPMQVSLQPEISVRRSCGAGAR